MFPYGLDVICACASRASDVKAQAIANRSPCESTSRYVSSDLRRLLPYHLLCIARYAATKPEHLSTVFYTVTVVVLCMLYVS